MTAVCGKPLRAVELRHGFTYGRVEELAWGAVGYDLYTRSIDLGDRFEAAWGAAVGCLYAAAEPPTLMTCSARRRRA